MTMVKKRVRQNASLARRAIADFVDLNIPRFNGWLEQVAGGIPQFDQNGAVLKNPNGTINWLVKPDPATALKLVSDICEYHLPKLSRSEQSIVARHEMGPIDINELSTEDLKLHILRLAGIDATDLDAVPVPEWINSK